MRLPVATLTLLLVFALPLRADHLEESAPVGSPAAPPSWQLVVESPFDFQVLMPPGLERVESTRQTWVGKVEELSLESVVEGGKFFVQVRQLPGAARWLVTKSFIFGEVTDALLHDGKRQVLSDEAITMGSYPGRHLRYLDHEREDWVEDAWIYLSRNRIYLVVASRARGADAGLPIGAFFESFRID